MGDMCWVVCCDGWMEVMRSCGIGNGGISRGRNHGLCKWAPKDELGSFTIRRPNSLSCDRDVKVLTLCLARKAHDVTSLAVQVMDINLSCSLCLSRVRIYENLCTIRLDRLHQGKQNE